MKFKIIGDNNASTSGDVSAKDISPLQNIALLNKDILKGDDVFLFIFMDHCGHCDNAKPAWDDIENSIADKYKNNENVVVVRVNSNLLSELKHVGKVPNGYPCFRHISHKGKSIKEYDDSVSNADRSTSSFIEWIDKNVKPQSSSLRGGGKRRRRTTRSKSSKSSKSKSKPKSRRGTKKHRRSRK
uniref:Thioredoxin domain-containing protein n=1 Tax=viral metagenome TaxID=1070528 RepID=A0A6C0EZG8_9ZZZZ